MRTSIVCSVLYFRFIVNIYALKKRGINDYRMFHLELFLSLYHVFWLLHSLKSVEIIYKLLHKRLYLALYCLVAHLSLYSKKGEVFMENVVVRARINPEIKEKASEYLASIGLTISDLIRITITKTANKQALPFDEIPNKETELALKESERGVGVHKAKDIDDLFSQIENDNE